MFKAVKQKKNGCRLVLPVCQAFCSSITGTLATQAMLKGYGVGDEKATALAATMTWILRSEIFNNKSYSSQDV